MNPFPDRPRRLRPWPTKALVLAACCLLGTAPSRLVGGTIEGTVRAVPVEVPGQAGAGGKYDSRKYKFLDRVNYDELRDFVVFVDQTPDVKPQPPKKAVQVVTQKDGLFRPHVLPILAGTTVEWPNRDEIFHNVFSFSETKPFDLGLYKDEPRPKLVTFDKAGRVDVFCSIHSQMHCIVLALETPYFASTDGAGAYAIRDVPAGHYRVKAWHERLPAQVREVDVGTNGAVTLDFVLSVKGLPKI